LTTNKIEVIRRAWLTKLASEAFLSSVWVSGLSAVTVGHVPVVVVVWVLIEARKPWRPESVKRRSAPVEKHETAFERLCNFGLPRLQQ